MKKLLFILCALFASASKVSADVQFVNNTPFKVYAHLKWDGGAEARIVMPFTYQVFRKDGLTIKRKFKVRAKMGQSAVDWDPKTWPIVVDKDKEIYGDHNYTYILAYTNNQFTFSHVWNSVANFGLTPEELDSRGINPVEDNYDPVTKKSVEHYYID